MNTVAIDLTQETISLTELLNKARQNNVLLRDTSGAQFILSPADDLTLEVDLLRRNHEFLSFLDESKKEQRTFSLDEVEALLR